MTLGNFLKLIVDKDIRIKLEVTTDTTTFDTCFYLNDFNYNSYYADKEVKSISVYNPRYDLVIKI